MSKTSGLVREILPRLEAMKGRAIEVAPAPISPCADRWLLASLLQKAIRRDQAETALGAAIGLLEMDAPRLWRRLATIALEDVGVGDLDVTLALLGVSTVPALRRALGGNRGSLEVMVPLACQAVKDRSADHLGSLVRHRCPFDGDKFDIANVPPYGHWRRDLLGAAGLVPAWKGSFPLEGVLETFRERKTPGPLLEACELYARRVRDELFILALAAWQIWNTASPEKVALSRAGMEGHSVHGIPDYAFDPLHTRLGRRAVEVWLKSYLPRPPFGGAQVAAALWNAEAALCRQTLFWSVGGEIKAAAYQADLEAHGLPRERHQELLDWIQREKPLLLSARQMVWASHVRSFEEKAA